MTNEVKLEIVAAAHEYMGLHKINATELYKLSGVNTSYLSNILSGVFTAQAGGAEVIIADKYFTNIAEAVGFSTKRQYWQHVMTKEFLEIIALLKEAKEAQGVKTIVVDSGAGKTYAVNQFKKRNPLNTYVITMHSLVGITDLFADLIGQLGISSKGSQAYRRSQLIIKLRDIKKNGGMPIVIIDEAENMNTGMMKMLKGFYDGLNGYCSIVLVGTAQLWDVMFKAKDKDAQSGPQFWRRFKPGTRHIRLEQRLEKRFEPFFSALGITDKGLRKLLCEVCDNYGELHDYLEPALRAADAKGAEIGMDLAFFRLYHNMPD